MKKVQYLVRINKDPESDWGASVPDLPECVATGKTIDSALRRIGQAIEMHLRGMREDGLRIPAPRHRSVRPRRTARQVDFYATVEVLVCASTAALPMAEKLPQKRARVKWRQTVRTGTPGTQRAPAAWTMSTVRLERRMRDAA
jgi:predicted RNase H-like HicB family nuclease